MPDTGQSVLSRALPPAQPGWQDALARQNARLNLDRPPRILLATIALGLAGLFVNGMAASVLVAVYLLTEALEPAIMAGFAAHPRRSRANLYLLTSVLGTSAFAGMAALLWLSPSLPVKCAAIFYLCGGFVNVVAVNAIYLPMAFSKVIPLTLAGLFMPVSIIRSVGFTPQSGLAVAAAGLLASYVLRLVHDTHRTERELAQSRARAAAEELAKARFLATLSHDLRTPVNTILGVTRMMVGADGVGMDRPVPEQVVPEQVGVEQVGVGQARAPAALMLLEEAALALHALIEDAMALAERGSDAPAGPLVAAPLRQSLRAAVNRLRPVAEARGIGLTLDLPAQVPELALTDPVLLRRAVVALLHHALLAAAPGATRLHLRALCDDDPALRLTGGRRFGLDLVIGAGAGSDSRPVAFDRPADPHFLQSARMAAGLMGGAVLHTGTSGGAVAFTLRLPLLSVRGGDDTAGYGTLSGGTGQTGQPKGADDMRSGAVPVEAGRGGMEFPDIQPPVVRLRVLVVDDIATNRFIVAHLLRRHGMQAVEAASGGAALQVLNQQRFDLVLLDMNMPDLSGAQTFAAIRDAASPWSQVPVIALTANALAQQRGAYEALGICGFVAKPVDSALLMAEIGRVMAHHALRKQTGPGNAPPGPAQSVAGRQAPDSP